MKAVGWFLPVGSVLLLLGSPADAIPGRPPIRAGLDQAGGREPGPACEEAKRTDGWCEAGNVGYVASVEIRSRMLYEALDAHGHDIEPEGVQCETCRRALKSDGFCPAHRMGYVRGLAYLSPLTYHIARARRIDPAEITCPVCREHTRGIGWCETHRVGIAGGIAIDDRRAFEEFSGAYRILVAAVETSARCETCAAAMVAEGYCANHRLKYRDGRAVPVPQP